MTWLHGLYELAALLAGSAVHISMKWSNWKHTERGRSSGGHFSEFWRDPALENFRGMISALVIFIAILARAYAFRILGIQGDSASHLLEGEIVAEMGFLFVCGYFIDSQAKNIMPILERVFMTRIRKLLDKLGGNGSGGKIPK